MLMVRASASLTAPEISLLCLLEVLLAPIWAWLGAGEVPAQATITGGVIVLIALVLNELASMRESHPDQASGSRYLCQLIGIFLSVIILVRLFLYEYFV
jgi:drug/metabolite transporter (DMT)-like permease